MRYARYLRAAGSLVAPVAYDVGRYAVQRGQRYFTAAGKRKVDAMFSTPTPAAKRVRLTGGSSVRFSPRRNSRTVAMTNLRRRLRRAGITPRRMRMRKNSGAYGAANSKSMGFIRTPARVKSRGRARATNLGVVDVIETGGVLDAGANTATAGNTVAVGHCQFPPSLAHLMFWRALIKKLAVLCKMSVYNFSVNQNWTVGSVFTCYYRLGPDVNFTSRLYVTALGDSLETVAQSFYNFFDTLDNSQDLEFHQLIFNQKAPAAGEVNLYSDGVMNLQNATFTIFSKSTLKVQNRTVQDAADDEESVDNVPLYGKAFYGKGSGTSGITLDQTYVGGPATGFWCHAFNGTMSKVPTEKWYQEIPQASHFRTVISTGKVHLDPGHIKTSVLDGKLTISLNKLYRILFRAEDTVNNHAKAILGRFRFIMLEKMINAVTGSATNSIKCAYEHNLRIGGYITLNRSTETAQLNNVANIDNDI